MKLRNKKTGEIFIFAGTEIHDGRVFFRLEDERGTFKREINSLTKLNEEWEDYEEPKDFWYIDCYGEVLRSLYNGNEWDERRKLIGNYFETREEAEKAVEKLKAWKRLKDKGFRFTGWTIDDGLRISICSNIDEDDIYDEDKRKIKPDLDLLFGGEE